MTADTKLNLVTAIRRALTFQTLALNCEQRNEQQRECERLSRSNPNLADDWREVMHEHRKAAVS